MAHGRLQAAITAVDIVLPLSLFIPLSLCDRYENEIHHCEITHLEMEMYWTLLPKAKRHNEIMYKKSQPRYKKIKIKRIIVTYFVRTTTKL